MRLHELYEEEPDTARDAVLTDQAVKEHATGEPAPDDWEGWLHGMFPSSVGAAFGEHHREVWDWAWNIEADSSPEPIVFIVGRGGAKSSTAELAAAAWGLRNRRGYGWYVRGTQERADDSLANIATLLESEAVERHYPAHAEREVSKYGHSRGWKSQRLRTAGGLVIDAIGLDTAARGLKVDDKRPDFIVLDDLDELHDTPAKTKKKLATLKSSVLPSGTGRTAVLAVQNLIIPNGIFTRLSDGRADFLATRTVIGPIPSIVGMTTEVQTLPSGVKRARITGGAATWAGQDLAECQKLMDLIGLRSFLQECQHQVKEREGALWRLDDIAYRSDVPRLVRVVVAVDPSGGGDDIGIIIAGLGVDGRAYVLADYTVAGSVGPKRWGLKVVAGYDDFSGSKIVAEKNFGGNLVEANILAVADGRSLPVKMVNASRGKQLRAEPVATLYERGMVDHVGQFAELEGEMVQWVPGDPDSPNRLDALVWALTELMLTKGVTVGAFYPGMEEPEIAIGNGTATFSGRLAITGVPRAGKTTLAAAMGGAAARSTDDTMDMEWSDASAEVCRWFDAPGDLLIEGVALPRALRKWLRANTTGRPVDRVIYLPEARVGLTRGQETMAAGVATVMDEIVAELEERGVVVEWGTAEV